MDKVDTDDIDDFIEYEFTKGCNENGNEIDYEQGYIEEHVEMLEEYEDDDIKPVIIEEIEEITPEDEYILEDNSPDNGEQFVNDNEIEEFEEFEEFTDYHEINLDQENSQHSTESKRFKQESLSSSDELIIKVKEEKDKIITSDKVKNGIKRYLLFDDLVATIVDYDTDNTPIVEFALARTETDEKLPVECGICPDVMSKHRLAKHLTSHLVSGTTNRYQCIYCDESYKDYKYLAGHARRHMGIRPYVCEQCKLYFSTKQDMRVHNQRRHLEKEHICEICGKTFAQNTQLKRHRESTHEKKRRFQCEYCPKAYYKNFSLKEHVRNVHLGKRRLLNCPFCGMKCRDAHKMARHRKEMHLNQNHYTCEICNEDFTEIHYFDAHKRSIQCRNNTKRYLEEQGIVDDNDLDDEEADEVMVPDESSNNIQYLIHQDQQQLNEVIVYDQMGPIVIEHVTNSNSPISVINQIVEQNEQEFLGQIVGGGSNSGDDDDHHLIPQHVTEHIINTDHHNNEHILPEHVSEDIIQDVDADFIYEVTLETQE